MLHPYLSTRCTGQSHFYYPHGRSRKRGGGGGGRNHALYSLCISVTIAVISSTADLEHMYLLNSKKN